MGPMFPFRSEVRLNNRQPSPAQWLVLLIIRPNSMARKLCLPETLCLSPTPSSSWREGIPFLIPRSAYQNPSPYQILLFSPSETLFSCLLFPFSVFVPPVPEDRVLPRQRYWEGCGRPRRSLPPRGMPWFSLSSRSFLWSSVSPLPGMAQTVTAPLRRLPGPICDSLKHGVGRLSFARLSPLWV